jgi:hypothetical protein
MAVPAITYGPETWTYNNGKKHEAKTKIPEECSRLHNEASVRTIKIMEQLNTYIVTYGPFLGNG